MQSTPHSSLTACLALYRTLNSALCRASSEDEFLAQMSAALATLSPEDRAALDSTDAGGSARRNRERAELHLRRELTARALLSG